MSILKTTDFKGFHRIAGSNDSDTVLQSIIDKYESETIMKVFGIKLGKLIIANIVSPATSPANAAYKKVWDAFQEVSVSGSGEDFSLYYYSGCRNNGEWFSEGMLELLKSVIFWHYVAIRASQSTQAGVTLPEVDTQARGDVSRFAEARWNNMIKTWESIHFYIEENITAYPDFVRTAIAEPKFNGLL